MYQVIVWMIVGIVVGVLAKKAPQGEGPWGVPGDVILGVIGALAGGWLFQNHMGPSYGGWIGSTLVALGAAVVVLFSLRFAVGGRTA